MRPLAVPFVLLVVAATPALAADPMSPAAKDHFDRGLALYGAGAYDQAVAELEAALRVAEHPDIYYALGQAERKRGHCARAIEDYRRFLRSNPPAGELEVTRGNILRCEEALAHGPEEPKPAPAAPTPLAPAAPPPAAPAGPPPAAPAGPVVPDAPAAPAWRSPVALALGGAGLALASVGAYFGARAASDWAVVNDAAARHGTWGPDLQGHYDDAGRARIAEGALLASGAAAALGGVLVYVLGSRPAAALRTGVAIAPQGKGLSLRCAF